MNKALRYLVSAIVVLTLTLGSMAEARKAGRLRSEGRTYRVADGDVLEILFSR